MLGVAAVGFQLGHYMVESKEDSSEQPVIILTTSWCGYCKKAKTLLRENGVAFVEYDIDRSAKGRELFRSHRGRGVPMIIVGDEVIRGFNPQAIRKAVGAAP